MSEDQLTALLARTGAKGKPSTADTSEQAFRPGDGLVIQLPMPPSTNRLFFNVVAGRVKTPEYQDWIKEAQALIAIQRPPKIKGRVRLFIEVAEPKTARRMDCTNRIKASEDILVTTGIIEGDDQRYVRGVTVEWAPIEGIRITIWSLE